MAGLRVLWGKIQEAFAEAATSLWYALITEIERFGYALSGLYYTVATIFSYVIPTVATAAAYYVIASPIWLAISMTTEPLGSSHPMKNLYFDVIYPWITYPIAHCFEWLVQFLQYDCAGNILPVWAHLLSRKCESLVGPPASVPLHAFDSVFHVVLTFSLGLGAIFALGKFGDEQLDLLQKKMNEAIDEAPDSLAGKLVRIGIFSSRALPAKEGVRIVQKRFERFVKRCKRWTAVAAYSCFFLTILVTGFLLSISPWHGQLVMPEKAMMPFYAYVMAPFIEAFALISVVVIIAFGRKLYPGLAISQFNRAKRKMKALDNKFPPNV